MFNTLIQFYREDIDDEDLDDEISDEESLGSQDSQESEEQTKTAPLNKKKTRAEQIQENIETLNDTTETTTGVLYIGHLPWGFEDKGIKKYFEQFGNILRILVPRSKKTGRVKGFAFVEFEDKETAQIAAKTMNNYILFDKLLKCSVVDDTSRYNLIFKKWKRRYKFSDKYEKFVKQRNKDKSGDEVREKMKLMLEKEEKKREKLAELGIKYDFPGFVNNILLNFNFLIFQTFQFF